MISRSHGVGVTLSARGRHPCGLCGQFRQLTRTHVPPQAAGNDKRVERAADWIDSDRVRGAGRWLPGGLWVRGLCEDCNNWAGRASDLAYADFAAQVRRLTSTSARTLLVTPYGDPPAATFAPGLVARCVMFGMFAIHPRLRFIFPELAQDLHGEASPGHGRIRWPARLGLRVGLSDPRAPRTALLKSGVSSVRVLGTRMSHHSFADIIFPPFTWSLVPLGAPDPHLGLEATHLLADASDWVNYGPDRTIVDLRNLTRRFPALLHPDFSGKDEWIELMGDSVTDAAAVIRLFAVECGLSATR